MKIEINCFKHRTYLKITQVVSGIACGVRKFLTRFFANIFLCKIARFRHPVLLRISPCCIIIKPSFAAPVFPCWVFPRTFVQKQLCYFYVCVLAFLSFERIIFSAVFICEGCSVIILIFAVVDKLLTN